MSIDDYDEHPDPDIDPYEDYEFDEEQGFERMLDEEALGRFDVRAMAFEDDPKLEAMMWCGNIMDAHAFCEFNVETLLVAALIRDGEVAVAGMALITGLTFEGKDRLLNSVLTAQGLTNKQRGSIRQPMIELNEIRNKVAHRQSATMNADHDLELRLPTFWNGKRVLEPLAYDTDVIVAKAQAALASVRVLFAELAPVLPRNLPTVLDESLPK